VAADAAAGEFIDYTRSLIAEKRRQPDESLLSGLVAVEDEGETLTEAELDATERIVAMAGVHPFVELLRQGADVMPRRQLEKQLVSELGPGWEGRLREFEWQPRAAASIAASLAQLGLG
jgi:cytochrome P450